MQEALDCAYKPMPKSRVTGPDGTVTWDGRWGPETTEWVRGFQAANGVPPGGWEAGRRTLDALDKSATGCRKRGGKGGGGKVDPPDPKPTTTKVCGPNVTPQVTRVWKQIQSDFGGWELGKRVNACRMLVQPIIQGKDGKFGINQDAFDTIGLYQPSMYYTHEPPFAGKCGVPSPPYNATDPFNPAYEDPTTCSNSVQMGAGCWLAGTPNYGTFGVMMRLCHDDIAIALALRAAGLDSAYLFGLAPTLLLAGGYKAYKRDNWSDPTKWAGATWVGGPTADPGGANRAECACTCPEPAPADKFDYIWETAHGTHDG